MYRSGKSRRKECSDATDGEVIQIFTKRGDLVWARESKLKRIIAIVNHLCDTVDEKHLTTDESDFYTSAWHQTGIYELASSMKTQLKYFFSRPWFTRLWILQEATSAPEPLSCGELNRSGGRRVQSSSLCSISKRYCTTCMHGLWIGFGLSHTMNG